tara:strand:+ start:7583 stop:8596 length:1014 start_codon:yes stop_codon:yes gene_type:complete
MIHPDFPLALAPMVGLSHVALRRLILDYLPDTPQTFWPTEMLNSRRLPYQDLGNTPETLRCDRDHNLVPQLLANEEEFIYMSVQKLKDWGAAAIDINMGCPVKKALRHNYGVSLMGDISYAAQITKWAKQASALPVSVKVRAGIESDSIFLKDFLQALEAAGASWITIHPRLAKEKRRGLADWKLVAKMKEHLGIPVIGNGDVQCFADIDKMFEIANCDAVMIGRSLNAKPWLLRQWLESKGKAAVSDMDYSNPEWQAKEYGRSMLKLLTYLQDYYGEALALRKFRFHIRTNHMWLAYGHQLIGLVNKHKSIKELTSDWLRFFEQPLRMYETTNLRY